jgi:hypothetical protein
MRQVLVLAVAIEFVEEVEGHPKVGPNIRIVHLQASALEELVVDAVTKLSGKIEKVSLLGAR